MLGGDLALSFATRVPNATTPVARGTARREQRAERPLLRIVVTLAQGGIDPGVANSRLG